MLLRGPKTRCSDSLCPFGNPGIGSCRTRRPQSDGPSPQACPALPHSHSAHKRRFLRQSEANGQVHRHSHGGQIRPLRGDPVIDKDAGNKILPPIQFCRSDSVVPLRPWPRPGRHPTGRRRLSPKQSHPVPVRPCDHAGHEPAVPNRSTTRIALMRFGWLFFTWLPQDAQPPVCSNTFSRSIRTCPSSAYPVLSQSTLVRSSRCPCHTPCNYLNEAVLSRNYEMTCLVQKRGIPVGLR